LLTGGAAAVRSVLSAVEENSHGSAAGAVGIRPAVPFLQATRHPEPLWMVAGLFVGRRADPPPGRAAPLSVRGRGGGFSPPQTDGKVGVPSDNLPCSWLPGPAGLPGQTLWPYVVDVSLVPRSWAFSAWNRSEPLLNPYLGMLACPAACSGTAHFHLNSAQSWMQLSGTAGSRLRPLV